MTKEEAWGIINENKHWNTAQTSVSKAIGGGETQEDLIFKARRLALAKAWLIVGEEEEPNA